MRAYVDIRDASGNLMFRYDPMRHVVHIRYRGRNYYIDLADVARIDEGEPRRYYANAIETVDNRTDDN